MEGFKEIVETEFEEIREAFGDRLFVDLDTAARILKIDAKTLRRHTKNGSVTYVSLGHGTTRIRRRFTCSDLIAFVAGRRRRDVPAPRPNRYSRRAGRGGEERFLDFVARRERERQSAPKTAGMGPAGGRSEQ